MNGASSVLFAFWGIVLYPSTDAATRYHKGTVAMFVVSAVLAGWIGLVWWLDRHVTKQWQQSWPAEGQEEDPEFANEKEPAAPEAVAEVRIW